MTAKQIYKILKKGNWDVQRAKAGLFLINVVYPNYANVGYGPNFCGYELGRDHYFTQVIDIDKINQKNFQVYSEYLKNPKSLDKLIGGHKKLTVRIDTLWDNYNKAGRKDGKSMAEALIKFKPLGDKWWEYAAIGEDKGGIINRKVVPYFEQRLKLSRPEALEAVFVLARPEEKSSFALEHELFLKICLAIAAEANEKKLSRLVNKYCRDFFWFKTDFYSSIPVTKESVRRDAQEKLREVGVVGIKAEIKKLSEISHRESAVKRKLLGKIKLNREDRLNLEFARKTVAWIDLRKSGMMKQFYYLIGLFGEICQELNIGHDELSNYFYWEVIDLLLNGKRISKKELIRRDNTLMLVFEKNKEIQVFYGAAATKMLKLGTVSREENIKGTVASLGHGGKTISGKVRVVIRPEKSGFAAGEILVTSMTRVEFVPLMRKAAAIITDEGGMACHAAIVSRELGLPAIIGTKNATQKLKTGNKIEMDLERGVVRILK
jgi:phosphohistidine swiveling domain-containing protein